MTLAGLVGPQSAHPDLLAGRGRVVGVALHEDEMRGREVQRAVRGFVAEAIHQAHLLHLHRTRGGWGVGRGVKKKPSVNLLMPRMGHGCSFTRGHASSFFFFFSSHNSMVVWYTGGYHV